MGLACVAPLSVRARTDRSDNLRIKEAVRRLIGLVSAAVRADLIESSRLVASRADGTGAHRVSLAEPLQLFYGFATHRMFNDDWTLPYTAKGPFACQMIHRVQSESRWKSK